MIKMEKTKRPAIRFKGFTDEWQQCKLSDLVDVYDGVHQTPDYKDRGIMFLSVENIDTLKSNKFISLEAFQRDYNVYPQKGDVLMTRIGDVGTPNVVETEEKVAFYVSLALLKPKYVDSYFLCNLIQSPFFQKRLKDRTLVTAVPQKINKEDIGKVELILSTVPDEQNKIGCFFKKLDNIIKLHQRKYDKLQNIKKACLEKMFPKNDSNVPEIRFKGFTDKWERYKFGDLYEKVSRKNDLSYGIDKIISVANMYFKCDSYITDSSYLLTYNIFEVGDIAFEGNKSMNFAHGRFVENTIGNGIVSHVFDVFKPKMDRYDLIFWKYAINNERIMRNILLRCTKSSTMMTNLVASDFLKETFLVPCYEEQKLIGSFLNNLDNLINLYHSKLEKLQNIKNACLEKMFV